MIFYQDRIKKRQNNHAGSEFGFYWNLWHWFQTIVSQIGSWYPDLFHLVEMRKHVTSCRHVGVSTGVKMNNRNTSIIIEWESSRRHWKHFLNRMCFYIIQYMNPQDVWPLKCILFLSVCEQLVSGLDNLSCSPVSDLSAGSGGLRDDIHWDEVCRRRTSFLYPINITS